MPTLFKNGLVVDGLGGHHERTDVLVLEGRVAAVGRSLAPPPGIEARVADLSGRTLMPGLIDTHVHIAGGDYFPGYEHEPIGVAALRTAEAARRTLLAGVTTIRTGGSRDFLDLDIRDAIGLGLVEGPRIIGSGRGITTTGGHLAEICMVADGVEEIRKAVRIHVQRGVNSIKLMMSAGVATGGLPVQAEQFSIDEVRAAVYEAHKVGLKVLTHAIGLGGIRNAVEAGVDSIDHGHYLDEEQATKMIQKGIYLVPTFGPGHYYTKVRLAEDWRIARAEAVAEQHARAFKLALDMGVKIAMGCDCGAPSRMPSGANALELQLMVEHGMSAERALVCATSEAANLVGLADLIGSVAVGKQADLIVLAGNPLDDIAVVQHGVTLVMNGGRIARDEI
jgi:imidazolonepropionase-like amidohydrolase